MIHPTAIISPDAEIDSDVTIGPFCIIESDVNIGSGTKIGAHSFIGRYTSIGEGNKIFNSVSLGGIPQDKKFNDEKSILKIGDHNTIREFVTINRGTADGGGATILGNQNWIMAYVHIAHDCLIGSHNVFANKATLAGHVEIRDSITLGGAVNIHQFVKVSSYAFLSVNSYINMDILPYVIAQGIPAKIRGLNSEGLKRHGFTANDLQDIRMAYKIIFKNKITLKEAYEEIKMIAEKKSKLNLFLEAIDGSNRGIAR